MRFLAVSRLIKRGDRLVDVGGGKGDFFDFSGSSGVIADLPPGASLLREAVHSHPYVVFDGENLPFRDEAFELVLSLDTLEHVPKAKRALLLRELLRVSNDRVVLTFPVRHHFLRLLLSIATLYDKLRISSVMKRSLEEHVRCGLPSKGEVLSSVDPTNLAVSESGLSGRLSTGIWIVQLLFPFLATRPVNSVVGCLLSKVPESEPSGSLVVLRKQKSPS